MVVAIASGAGTRGYRGAVAGGGAVHFGAEVTNGQIVQVRGLGWRRVEISCQQGKFPFRGGFEGEAFTVEAGTFHAHGNAGGALRVAREGHRALQEHGQRAAGTIRYPRRSRRPPHEL